MYFVGARAKNRLDEGLYLKRRRGSEREKMRGKRSCGCGECRGGEGEGGGLGVRERRGGVGVDENIFFCKSNS